MIPTPTILDNLIAAKKIGPTVAIFVNNVGERTHDLGGYAPFADFIALELIPWARANYRIKDGPGHVVLTGSSRGGLAASHCAFYHSDASATFSRSPARSGSEMTIPILHPCRSPSIRATGPLFPQQFARANQILHGGRSLRFATGHQPGVPGRPPAERLSRDYREFDGGHDYFYWRGSLADGLISLIGQNRD